MKTSVVVMVRDTEQDETYLAHEACAEVNEDTVYEIDRFPESSYTGSGKTCGICGEDL